MPRYRHIDLPLLYRLWNTPSLTRCEVARQLGVTQGYLGLLVKRHKLPPRGHSTKPTELSDPTPDEIAERARECRERHYAMRRSEERHAVS